MVIIVSACLVGENCKYNGKNNYKKRVLDFLEGHEIVTVCPEVMGGLPTPRPSCEIVNGRVININGEDKTEFFYKGASEAYNKIKDLDVKCAVLQSRSPSCGVNQIYDGSFSGTLISGRGLFAEKLFSLGYKVIDSEDI